MVSACIYTFIYLFYSFTVWGFENPIRWIIELPTYTGTMRFGILLALLFYWAMLLSVVAQIESEKKKNKSQS